MKKRKLFSLYQFSLFLFSILLVSCSNTTGKNPGTSQKTKKAPASEFAEVPELQERDLAYGSNEEMDNISRIYNESVAAVKSDPYNMKARLTLSEVFITEGRLTGNHTYNYNAAIQVLDEVLNSDSTTQDQRYRALVNKATVKLSLHKFAEAKQTGHQALIINNRNATVYGVLVDANVELGNYKEAVKMSDKMVGIRPDLRSYSRISYIRQIYGDMEGAKEAMKLAVAAGYPGMEQTEWCRITLGKLYEDYGDLKTAEMHYRIALRERPNYSFAMAALGNVERKKGNLEKAEELLTKATKYIDDASFYERRAEVYRDMGEEEKAQADFTTALNIMQYAQRTAPEGGEALDGAASTQFSGLNGTQNHQHGLGIAKLCLQEGDDLDNALENAQKEYDRRPDNIDVNKALAMIYYERGNMEKAQDHLAKALATNTKDPELVCLKGMIKVKTGNEAQGKKLIRESFKTNPHQEAGLADEARAIIAS